MKYYFISFAYNKAGQLKFNNCLFQTDGMSLKKIVESIKKDTGINDITILNILPLNKNDYLTLFGNE